MTGSATFGVTMLGAHEVYGELAFDPATMSVVHVGAPERMYEIRGGELGALSDASRLADVDLVLDTPLSPDTQTAKETIWSHTGANYSQAEAPTGLTEADAGALWYDTINAIQYRWDGTQWVEQVTHKVVASELTIDPPNGLVVRQYLSNQMQIPTYFRANARAFGLYNNDGSAFAEAYLEGGRGVFAASRMLAVDGSGFSAELGAEYQSWAPSWGTGLSRTWRGLLLKQNMSKRLFLGTNTDSEVGSVLFDTGGNSYRIHNRDYSLIVKGLGGNLPSVMIDADCDRGRGVMVITADGGNYSAWFRLNGTNGNCTVSKAWGVSSDRRLKQDIEDIQVNLIDRLKPRQYHHVKHPGRLNYGLIAQEVQQAIEEAGIGQEAPDIINIEEDGMMGLVYEQFIPLLIDKVQKQQRQIGDLQQRLDDQQNMINSLLERAGL